ncbi:MAG: hypothetical protein HETSPECPRED_008221 [Heterodermia speciosa]|uniref:GRIP domain-containing protein n=1 Tax=Heterodermia speciosa TaxID=116794 RepID=A0A8H3FTF2_9LECA|nr:MAG: hypothetical protein HETSPECPRED_008221 [Heterodermia speciosa]
MSSNATINAQQDSPSVSKSKKHRKKKTGGRDRINENGENANGVNVEKPADQSHVETDEQEQEPDTSLSLTGIPFKIQGHALSDKMLTNGDKPSNQTVDSGTYQILENSTSEAEEAVIPLRDASYLSKPTDEEFQLPESRYKSEQTCSEDTEARLDALARERETLRDEVAQLRRSLEELQGKHEEELIDVKGQLEETQGEKDHAETQYRNLLGKVNTIKSQLGERLKADAEELSQARGTIEELEQKCGALQEQNDARSNELKTIAEEGEQRSKELSSLRNRTTLSQQNWSKERDDLLQREAYAREEFEAAKQAMQDWEVLAIEERSMRENFADRVADLEDQVSTHREAHEKAASERDCQSLTVDGLQRALQEIQDARRQELRELVESSQSQVESLQKQLREIEGQAADATTALEAAKQELERALPFEKEVKEKNLLIGKLRHEAVILNDHLTKALKYLKKGKPDENIDKQLISNHVLRFLAFDRADPKKFEILQIIAALLAWSDEQREQAGLARPGASNQSLKVPLSPWHRTPSTPSLSTDLFPESSSRKESLADLWSNFLEQESQEGVQSPNS